MSSVAWLVKFIKLVQRDSNKFAAMRDGKFVNIWVMEQAPAVEQR